MPVEDHGVAFCFCADHDFCTFTGTLLRPLTHRGQSSLASLGAGLTIIAVLLDPSLQGLIVYTSAPTRVGDATNFRSSSYAGEAVQNLDTQSIYNGK